MQKQFYLVALFCIITGFVNAQGLLKGTVVESGSNNKMSNVFIRDMNNKQLALSNPDGSFAVRTETGHTIIFESPGYVSDTLYVADMTNKKITLVTKTIALKEVSVVATRRQDFDPEKEYPDVYTKSKVYVLSPTSWFSKDAKDARRLKKYFKSEAQERHVDEVFSRAYVGSIVPLKGQELEDFMTMYRPSYEFLRSNNSESLVAYINDSYKKYQALPPDKRSLQKLTSQ